MTARPTQHDEEGFTLVEVMVVALIMAVIAAALFGLVVSMTGNERAQEARAENGRAVRLAIDDIARDLRGADPLAAPADASSAPSTIEVTVMPPTAEGAPQHVRWILSGGRLSRAVLDAHGDPTSTRLVLTDVHNEAEGLALFRYLDRDGTALPNGVAPADIVNCTRAVRVTIAASPEPGYVATESADAMLRNPTGGVGC